MTSSVMVLSSLIFMTRSTWVKSRSMMRKLPRVMRATVATAWASGRYSWANPTPAVGLLVAAEAFFDAGHAWIRQDTAGSVSSRRTKVPCFSTVAWCNLWAT